MNKIPHVAAIHDISGMGRCSLTTVLPILSCAGIQCSVLPTAVLSTHTGGFTGYTYRDLTEDMIPFMNHWQSLGVGFDSLYSGFLGSFEQIEIVSHFFDMFKTERNIVFVDPVMGDNGRLYATYTDKMANDMVKLCKKADIIIPNMTEAHFLTGQSYREGPYTREYVEGIIKGLRLLGAERIVLTGIYFDEKRIGAACLDRGSDDISYCMSDRITGFYHGTGDIFAAVVLSALLNGFSLAYSMGAAVRFVYRSIIETARAETDPRYGVLFERLLPDFSQQMCGGPDSQPAV